MANTDYTRLNKHVTQIGKTLLTSQLESNLKTYLDWGLLGVGSFSNVSKASLMASSSPNRLGSPGRVIIPKYFVTTAVSSTKHESGKFGSASRIINSNPHFIKASQYASCCFSAKL